MAAVHNGFFPRVQAEFRGCCNYVMEVIRKVVIAVRDFFEMVIRFIFCMRQRVEPAPAPERPHYVRPPHRPQVFHVDPEDGPIVIPNDPQLVDAPVNLEDLRHTLWYGENNPPISKHMTPRDFITLIDEFPNEQRRIGEWAEKWARPRVLKIDPQHPYFEIFQRAFQFKDQISGGAGRSADYTTYSINYEKYYNWPKPLFPYIIYSLMGFQELSRDDNRELMRKLDNQQPTFEQNPAYKYARALSKINAYPTRPDNGEYRLDIRDKLQMGISAPMEAYRAAVAHNKVLEYFQSAFNLRHCFDYRVSELQEFIFLLENPNVDDFSANTVGKDTTDHRVLEYFRVFRNEQAFKMARILGINYLHLKDDIQTGRDTQYTRHFNQNYCTRDQFELYLAENHQPIREKPEHPINQQVHMIPQQADWRNGLPLSPKKVPIQLIPVDLRQVGAVLGVRDPSAYQVTIRRIRPQIALVDFSEQKSNRLLGRLMNYPLPWRGTEYRKEVNLDTIPRFYRYLGAEVGVIDPSVYQVKVLAVDARAGTVTIDFRGDPITRERWERALDEN